MKIPDLTFEKVLIPGKTGYELRAFGNLGNGEEIHIAEHIYLKNPNTPISEAEKQHIKEYTEQILNKR